jgi:CheY-like chemotaxis protein
LKSRGVKTIKILHIDDEINQLDFTKLFLEEIDKEVEVISKLNPEDALKYIKEPNSFDCIISDYKMLPMNGIELAEKVREKSSIPFILYTGQGSEEIAERAFEAGIDDYLNKEIDPSHYKILAKRVRLFVEKHRDQYNSGRL